jgi:hypothetical protein
MTATTVDNLFEGSTGRNTRGLLRLVILCTIAAAAIASRLFSVIRTYSFVTMKESVGHLLMVLSEMAYASNSLRFTKCLC